MFLVETVTHFSFDQKLVFLDGHRIAALANFFCFSTLHIFTLDSRTLFPTEEEVIACFSLSERGLFIFLLVSYVIIQSAHSRQVCAMFDIRGQDQHFIDLQLLTHLVHTFRKGAILYLVLPIH